MILPAGDLPNYQLAAQPGIISNRTWGTVAADTTVVYTAPIRNDLALLQSLINAKYANGGGYVDLPADYTFQIIGDLTIKPGVTLRNGKIQFAGLSRIYMTGNSPAIHNVTIDSGTYGNALRGVIELLESNNAKITNVTIKGNHDGKAIYCRTRATDTYISYVTVDKIGWGILFNDAESERGAGFRTVNGIDYSNGPIGSGLYVDHYTFGDGTNTYAGDGIEVNAPDYGFSKIVVSDSIVNRTNKTVSNGIAYGFANCNDVVITNSKAYNVALDGFHFEYGKNHTVTNSYSENSFRALSVTQTENTTISNNSFIKSAYWGVSYNLKLIGRNTVIENNIFDGATQYGMLVSNAENDKIRNNVFRNFIGQTNAAYIQLYNAGAGGVTQSEITGNIFEKDSDDVTPVKNIYVDKYSTNNVITNNQLLPVE